MDPSIQPFKIHISNNELDLLRRKLELTRLPPHDYAWTEENGITSDYLQEILDFWLTEYSWRDEEARINASLPQFTTKIAVDGGFGELDVHFVYSRSTASTTTNVSDGAGGSGADTTDGKGEAKAIPLLFLHGWPGSFLEVSKGLSLLNAQGFDVVAPSLPGYGFSSYTRKRGFDHRQHAEVMDKLMRKLGYGRYVVQGGDWGSAITRAMGVLFPERVVALHQNMLQTPRLTFPDPQPTYTAREQHGLDRAYRYFIAENSAYSQIQAQRPITLGHAMHDSPMGLLSYIADKLITWSDDYPWSPAELITWTLMHYFPGPTNGFLMYTENNPPAPMVAGSWAAEYVTVPSGYTSLPQEIIMVPRVWAEKVSNCVFYREHERGGHFAMWEVPEVLVGDCVEFFRSVWENTSEL